MNITNIQIVTAFELDSTILLTCGASLKKLSEKLKWQFLQINTPDDAPPSLPRIVLRQEDSILNVALERFQITMIPPSHISHDIQQSIDYVRQKSTDVLSELLDVMPPYLWTGIIIGIEYPLETDGTEPLSKSLSPMFDKLINIDRNSKDLSSLELQFGFQDSEYYIIYKLQGYERRKISFPIDLEQGQSMVINADQFPRESYGYEIIVDINNKPAAEKHEPMTDLNLLFDKHIDVISSIKTDLNLEEVLP